MKKRRRRTVQELQVMHFSHKHFVLVNLRRRGRSASVDRQQSDVIGGIALDEAVEMTPEEMEFIMQRVKGRTFSHERISTPASGESWWSSAQRLFQQREQRLQELTQQLGE